MKKIIYIALFSMFIFSISYATKPSIPSLKMEMSIIHDGNWEVGKENRVTFKFKPLQEVPHKIKQPDEAEVTFDSGLVLVTGNPIWSGFLEKGKEYSISVLLRPTKAGKFVLWGGVEASLSEIYSKAEKERLEAELNRTYESSPELKKRGMKAKIPEKVFYFHNGISEVLEVKGTSTDLRDTTWIESNGVKVGPVKVIRPLDSLLRQPLQIKKRETPPLEEPGNDSSQDSSQSKNSGESLLPYIVYGTFRYLNNFSIYWPIKDAYIEQYYYDSSISDWAFEQTSQTNFQGQFSVYVNHRHVAVVVYPYNQGGVVFYTDGHLDGGDTTQVAGRGFQVSGLSGDYNAPLDLTTFTDFDVSGAYQIADDIRFGYIYVVGVASPPRLSYIYWDPLDNSVSTSYSTLAVGTTRIIIIQGRSVLTKDRDEWDPNVVLHEYSHFLMDEFAEIPPNAGGSHRYWVPPSGPSVIPKNLAWSEGWANFFQGAIFGTPAYVDRDNNNAEKLKLQLETPEPDVPYIDSSGFNNLRQTVPSQSQPVYFAYNVEGSITEALWDIFDFSNDDNYVIGLDTFGHNNDHNQNDSWRGITAIWDVFDRYDPAPPDTGHNNVWDFFEFIYGWKAQGYPILGHFANICNSHALFIKRGDANFDIIITLPDINYLTNYIFYSGPAPLTVCNGDATNDGIINLSDVVYLVNYVFKGGPAPTPTYC